MIHRTRGRAFRAASLVVALAGVLAAVVALALVEAQGQAGDVLLYLAPNGSNQPLHLVDPETGSDTEVGGRNGTTYGMAQVGARIIFAQQGDSRFLVLNRSNGSQAYAGRGHNLPNGAAAVLHNGELLVFASSGLLFNAHDPDTLIRPSTGGLRTLSGGIGAVRGALSYQGELRLLDVSGNTWTVDAASGQATMVAHIDGSPVGLAEVGGRILTTDSNVLYEIDWPTGARTRVGPTSNTIHGEGALLAYRVPAPPVQVDIDGVTATADSVRVEWRPQPTERTATGYDVRYRISGAASWTELVADPDGGAQSVTIDGLQAGRFYEVEVRAYNGDGAGPWSVGAVAYTTGALPTTYGGQWTITEPAFEDGVIEVTALARYAFGVSTTTAWLPLGRAPAISIGPAAATVYDCRPNRIMRVGSGGSTPFSFLADSASPGATFSLCEPGTFEFAVAPLSGSTPNLAQARLITIESVPSIMRLEPHPGDADNPVRAPGTYTYTIRVDAPLQPGLAAGGGVMYQYQLNARGASGEYAPENLPCPPTPQPTRTLLPTPGLPTLTPRPTQTPVIRSGLAPDRGVLRIRACRAGDGFIGFAAPGDHARQLPQWAGWVSAYVHRIHGSEEEIPTRIPLATSTRRPLPTPTLRALDPPPEFTPQRPVITLIQIGAQDPPEYPGHRQVRVEWRGETIDQRGDTEAEVLGAQYYEVYRDGQLISDGESPPRQTFFTWTEPRGGPPREITVRGVADGPAVIELTTRVVTIPAGETRYSRTSVPYRLNMPAADAVSGGSGEWPTMEPTDGSEDFRRAVNNIATAMGGDEVDPDGDGLWGMWLFLCLLAATITSALYFAMTKNLSIAAFMFALIFGPMWGIGGVTLAGIGYGYAVIPPLLIFAVGGAVAVVRRFR
ncbi:MAG: fibronectin type III domain-containing protein [Chloroflexi bacterium]|nr:fibronectin type III domain-containing protein [Chloroflexota bacterium]